MSPRVSLPSPEAMIVPTTNIIGEGGPKFRLLIVGRSGTGKSSLVEAVFGPALRAAIREQAGKADINREITVPRNRGLIVHYYEPDNVQELEIVARFIIERSLNGIVAEELHAVWFCTPAPLADDWTFQGDNMIFILSRTKVPIVVVVTKFDLFVAKLENGSAGKGKINLELSEKKFKERYNEAFQRSTMIIAGRITYALVTIKQPRTLFRVVDLTMQSVEQMLLAATHGVNIPAKVAATVKLVAQKYWSAKGFGIPFRNVSLEKYIHAIHKDIVAVWNVYDLGEFLLSGAFRRRMMVMVEDLKDTNTMQSKVTMASASGGLAKLWTNSVYKSGPEHARCLMGYIVDLTLILQVMFKVSLQDQYEGSVTVDHVDEILYEFHCSEKKKTIHHAIRTFTQHSFTKDNVVKKIQSLLKENQMTQTDTQLNKDRPPLRPLLTILRFELTANGLVVNRIILDLVCKLSELPDFRSVVPGMHPLDIELLLDFILYLLTNYHLSICGVPEANRKARRLMAKLISEAHLIPQSLSITNVSFDADHSPIGIGDRGRVFKGKYKEEAVALKMLDNFNKGQTDLFQEFCKEALVWRSLTHRFILPLLGTFKEQKMPFLVSPLMPNGTLMEWRKNIRPLPKAEIHRLILEIAEGVQYLHSEGIVHGDIEGENILLDSNFHCKIIGFGLTRHCEDTATGMLSYTPHYAAPELFGKCSECNRRQCCHGKHEIQKKTTETDVYAFGCLYYAVFFNSVPYEGKHLFHICRLVTTGERPPRLENPKMEDSTWNLINDCWKSHPSERPPLCQLVKTIKLFVTPAQESYFQRPSELGHPTMAQVLETPLQSLSATYPSPTTASTSSLPATSLSSPAILAPLPVAVRPLPETFQVLLAIGTEFTTPGSSIVNKVIFDLICELLTLDERHATITSGITLDIGLLLNFLFEILRNNSLKKLGIQGANRKVRKSMFELITMSNIIPVSLFIGTEVDIGPEIAVGGFGSVFKGECAGRPVALKMLTRARQTAEGSLEKEFYKEALTWGSISHRFILPLLGIYVKKPWQFLVSPFMTNGTITQWRKNQGPDVVEIHRLMLEVAEAIQYLHSEGIIHGDLHGGNVLLDSEFRCQITDFGLTRHFDASVVQSTKTFVSNFAAPELFGMCSECCQQKCKGCFDAHRRKTVETDVYAFGCLYYAIFFDTVPFQGEGLLQIIGAVTSGTRPDRLESPRMEDNLWNLIQKCWTSKPLERPTMREVVKTLAPLDTVPV